MITKTIKLKSHGKINLYLAVIGRRQDGYHNIESLMQDIDLFDDVSVSLKDDKESDISCFISEIAVDFKVDSDDLPRDENNLAIKGIKAFTDLAQDKQIPEIKEIQGVAVKIEKRVPVAAGLAGGSGNAAAVILALNEMLGRRLTLRELMRAGETVGADVPFSLMMNAKKNEKLLKLRGLEEASCAANVSGIGEIVEPTSPLRQSVILINPGIFVSTKEVYDGLDEIYNAEYSKLFVYDLGKHPKLFYNNMAKYTLRHFEEARALEEFMRANLSADTILMSGSGPTMAAYYTDKKKALREYNTINEKLANRANWRAWLIESGGQTDEI